MLGLGLCFDCYVDAWFNLFKYVFNAFHGFGHLMDMILGQLNELEKGILIEALYLNSSRLVYAN